jgi:hypothetical protein
MLTYKEYISSKIPSSEEYIERVCSECLEATENFIVFEQANPPIAVCTGCLGFALRLIALD